MRIGILGAGSIGCYIGGCLAHRGEDVVFVGRAALGEEIATHGLHLLSVHGERRVVRDVQWATEPDVLSDVDVVLVAVKGLAIDDVGRSLARILPPEVAVLALQNGVSSAARLSHYLDGPPVWACSVSFNVLRRGKGTFLQGTSGPLSTHVDVPHALIAKLERAGLPVVRYPDMAPVLWGKLLVNLNNAINALADVPLLEQFQDRGLRRVMAAAIDEGLRVVKAAGIEPISFLPVPPWALVRILRLPTWLFLRVARSMVSIDPEARSSMWEDLAHGRKTEVRLLNGEVATLGQRYGVPTPVNAFIVDAIEAVEHGEDRAEGLPELIRLADG